MNFSQQSVANLRNPTQIDFSFTVSIDTNHHDYQIGNGNQNNCDVSFAQGAGFPTILDRSGLLDQTFMGGLDETVAFINPNKVAVPNESSLQSNRESMVSNLTSQQRSSIGSESSCSGCDNLNKKTQVKVKQTSEEILLQELAKKRDMKLQEKLANQKFYQKLKTTVQPNTKSNDMQNSKALNIVTQTQGFNFQTDKRKQKYSIDKVNLLSPTANNQRKQTVLGRNSQKFNSGKKTVPTPFNLSESTNSGSTLQSKKQFVSLKNKIESFFREGTYSAQRSSTKKKRTNIERENSFENQSPSSQKGNIMNKLGNSEYNPNKLTKAQSPLLKTDQRHNYKSNTMTTEEQILREIQNHGQFKARPMNKRIFQKTVGVPAKMEKLTTNQFQEFNLLTNQRCPQKDLKLEEPKQELKVFKALELNKKIFEAPIGMYERKSAPPLSHNFQFKEFKLKSDERVEEHNKKRMERQGQEEKYEFKAREMPKFPMPPSPQKSVISSNAITFKEFNLQTDRRVLEFKERKSCPPPIKKENFHAQPMPDFQKLHQQMIQKPMKNDYNLTIPNEFALYSERRSAYHSQQLQLKLQKEQEELEIKRNFKAQPIPDYEKMKIEIQPSGKPLTQPSRPLFYADMLPPKKEKSIEINENKLQSPPHFKF
eukprot:403377448